MVDFAELFSLMQTLGYCRLWRRTEDRILALLGILPYVPKWNPPVHVVVRVADSERYNALVKMRKALPVNKKMLIGDVTSCHKDVNLTTGQELFFQLIPASLEQDEVVLLLRHEAASMFASRLQETLRQMSFFRRFRSQCDYPISGLPTIAEFVLEVGEEMGYSIILAVVA